MTGKVLLVTLLSATPAFAGLTPIEVEVSLRIAGHEPIYIGRAQGSGQILPGGRLVLAPLSFTAAVCTSIPLSGLSPVSALLLEATGLEAGTIQLGGPGTGNLGLSGTLLVRLFSDAPGDLEIPLSIGVPASPTARRAVASPSPNQTTFVALTASFSSWRNGSAMLTQTASGQITSTTFTAPAAIAFAADQEGPLRLVSPMHIYVAHSEGDFSAEVRTIAGAAQLRLTVPEPARLVLDLVGVAAIALVGVWRLHVRRARAVRGDRLS